MEEGEVACSSSSISTSALNDESIYSPAFEWPGDPNLVPLEFELAGQTTHISLHTSDSGYASSAELSSRHAESASLRLLALKTSILPKSQSLAVIDGYTEVQVGRDVAPPGSDTPRIRLKEMEVSKVHATIYWDQDRCKWAVVDMGSKHGTFLQSSRRPEPSATVSSAEAGDPGRVRLSPSRIASIPRSLKHLDQLSIGGTTFLVHIHDDNTPCADCSPKGGDEIPLFGSRDADLSKKRKRGAAVSHELPPRVPPAHRDPKRALTELKRDLLSRHRSPAAKEAPCTQYVDRSAKRRTLHPHAVDPPAAHTKPLRPSSLPLASASAKSIPPPNLPPVSEPPKPLPDSNIGHRLLLKQGWQPGTTLGQVASGNLALVEPLEVSGNTGRVGLGAKNPSVGAVVSTLDVGPDWRDAGKTRRWASVDSK